MVQFDAKSAGRISKSVRYTERQTRNIRSQRGRWHGREPQIVMFELLEALAQWSGDVVTAARKNWDPGTANGVGGYIVDCDDVILVADFNEVGHNAGNGGFGTAIMHARADGTLVGTIIDLCCPGDEQGVCGV